MEGANHRIAFALYFKEKWNYGEDDEEILEKYGIPTTPEEFSINMKGKIYCPKCKTPLSRSPEVNNVTTNNRTAHYRHKPRYKKVPCILKSVSKKGVSYRSEEEAKKAVEDGELVIVSDWMSQPPTMNIDIDDTGEFNQTAIEDSDGPDTDVPIGRHFGDEVKVPSKISSVAALCWNFDRNLHSAFYLPNSRYPMLLSDILCDVNRISKEKEPVDRLYFGRIIEFQRLNHRDAISVACEPFGTVKIYSWPALDERKRISEDSIGRYIVFAASIYWQGNNPSYKMNDWGRYSLLPTKYEKNLELFKRR